MVLVVALLAACSTTTEPSSTTTTTTEPPTTTTTTEPSTTTTRPEDCAAPPYDIATLPSTVSNTPVDPSDIPSDPLLEVAGSSSEIWLDEDGGLALVLVRGTLPLEEWPGESGQVSIDGVEARVGPFDDGSWVVGWFEESGDRCDRYTMVFYPPVDAAEVEASLLSMDRTAG